MRPIPLCAQLLGFSAVGSTAGILVRRRSGNHLLAVRSWTDRRAVDAGTAEAALGSHHPDRGLAAHRPKLPPPHDQRSLCSPAPAKIWSHAAISFATVYASLVSLVYVTWLFVVEPHVLNGTESQVELLVFKPGSFMQMVDGIGYTFMGVAALFAAPCFNGPGLAR
jgi:hypothetical protein